MRLSEKNKHEKLLFLALLRELTETGGKRELAGMVSRGNIDWPFFKKLLVHHELFSFAYPVFKTLPGALPPELDDFFKNTYYSALLRAQNMWREFLQIAAAFESRGISVLPLKGVGFIEDIYAQAPVRLMTDIDILAKEDELEKAVAVLLALGYKKDLEGLTEEYWRTKQYHLVFQDRPKRSIIELHWGLDYKRKKINLFPELWGRTREFAAGEQKIKLLSPEDSFLSLALHNRRFGKALCLKNIFDLVLLLRKYGKNFDWGYVLGICGKYKLNTTAFFILCQAEYICRLDIPQGVFRAFKIPRWKQNLVRAFIAKNTLNPDAEENSQNYLLSHFLLYDNFREPVGYIINIPQEQFAKFYHLPYYERKTVWLYKLRFFYIPARALISLFFRENNHPKKQFSLQGQNG